MRLSYFDHFRGIAIIFIVAAHSLWLWHSDSFFEKTAVNLINGGTTFFVFISGFFFYYIYYKNFNYRKFLLKKIKVVLLPYLFFSIPILFFYFISSKPLPHFNDLSFDANSSYIQIFITYLWTGRVFANYWFIPFICVMFLISPIVIKFIRLNVLSQLIIVLTLLIISIYIGRPAHGLSTLHSSLFFLPVYLIGILSSIYKTNVINFIKNKTLILGGAVIALAMAQAYIYGYTGNLWKDNILTYEGIDISLLQKIVMSFLFISVLQKIEKFNLNVFNLFAAASFPIFLIHPVVMEVFDVLGVYHTLNWIPGLILFLLNTVVVFGVSLLIAWLLKKILKDNSQYFIGWK